MSGTLGIEGVPEEATVGTLGIEGPAGTPGLDGTAGDRVGTEGMEGPPAVIAEAGSFANSMLVPPRPPMVPAESPEPVAAAPGER